MKLDEPFLNEEQEKIIPKEEYDLHIENDNGEIANIHVDKIKLQYNEKYQNVIGWSHVG